MMQGQSKAITFEDYLRRGGGGNGRDPRDNKESLLSPVWKRWAQHLINKQIERVKQQDWTPRQVVDLGNLNKEFERVSEDTDAAYKAVLERSPFLNHPVTKVFIR